MGNLKRPIIVSLVIVGATAVSSQIILLRELLTVFYGNEISVGFMLAVWLFAGAIGSGLFGRFLAEESRDKILLFSGFQILASLTIPLSIILSRVIRLYFNTAPGEILGIPYLLIWSLMILSPMCISLGILFVAGCNIYTAPDEALKIGSVYVLEAAGSAVGGILTSFILIRIWGSLQIALFLAFLNLIAAFFIARGALKSRWSKIVKSVSLSLAVFIILFSASGTLSGLQQKTMRLKWKGMELLESKDSIYGRNVIARQARQYSFFSNGLHMFSAPDAFTSEETAHFPMLSHPDPKYILLIGGGASGVMKEILKYPVKRVDYVELDAQIIELAKKYLQKEPYYKLGDKRVFVINQDARFFIRNTETSYDVCIINLPNPYTSQINRFYTVEFFRGLKRVLNPGAVAAFSVSSSENYISRKQARFLASLFGTARSAFSGVEIVPGDTAHFLLSDKSDFIKIDSKKFSESLERKAVKTLFVNKYYLFSRLSEERIDYLKGALSRAKDQGLNLDFRPVSYFYDMVLWSAHFSSGFSRFFDIVNGRLIGCAALIISAVMVILSFFGRKRKGAKKRAALLALCTTGFSEIAFQMFIILAFQVIYGYLYYKLGVIIASFMTGLGLGSFFITGRLGRIKDHYATYIKVQGFVCIYPLVLLAVFSFLAASERAANFWINANLLFASLPFIAGFAGGAQFPLANKIYLGEKAGISRAAGSTYAIDLAGSCAGALLVSAVLIPVIGISGSCILVSMLNLAGLCALLVTR